MNKRKTGILPPVGVTSLLVIFAVLCLTVFALLTVSTVQADVRLQTRSRQTALGYYAADCEAEAILARLRAGERPAGVQEEDGIFSYTCTISETQALVVEAAVSGDQYQILRWQVVSTVDWEATVDLPVWEGA